MLSIISMNSAGNALIVRIHSRTLSLTKVIAFGEVRIRDIFQQSLIPQV